MDTFNLTMDMLEWNNVGFASQVLWEHVWILLASQGRDEAAKAYIMLYTMFSFLRCYVPLLESV